MKKYLLLLLPFFFPGCEKDFDQVIDNTVISYQVINVGIIGYSTNDTIKYAFGDSLITFFIKFNSPQYVQSAMFDIYASNGEKLNASRVSLFDDGLVEHGDSAANDGQFSNKFPLSQSNPNGKYEVQFFVTDVLKNTKKAAVQNFEYDNGQANVAPVVANLIAPDTVYLDTSQATPIHLSLEASDSNGLNDIEIVFFNSFIPPNGNPSVNNPFELYDNGNPQNGDQTAGDGIYSLIIQLPPTGVTKGTYRWEFQAKDRRNALSNKIIHEITIL